MSISSHTSERPIAEAPARGWRARPVYLDCNATTPTDPRVAAEVMRFMQDEFGNAGSRTHDYGLRAKQATQHAREQVARLAGCGADEVFFTSGATESDNIAILGLAPHGESTGRRHILASAIEHKAVLEPLDALAARGFTVELVPPGAGGWVEPEEIRRRLRPDTLLVSIMHVNNETGVIQPLRSIVSALADHPAFFHVDAAQGFGKEPAELATARIDLLSISAHKLYGPKGVGALVARRRKYTRPPLTPIAYGGGQERGLRPGTLPVPLVVGFGLACDLATQEGEVRREKATVYRGQVLAAFDQLGARINGDPARTIPTTVNLSVPGLDSEAVMVALKGVVAISNGSACTSQSYEASHVLTAMGLSEDRVRGALRISWCYLTEDAPWESVVERVRALT